MNQPFDPQLVSEAMIPGSAQSNLQTITSRQSSPLSTPHFPSEIWIKILASVFDASQPVNIVPEPTARSQLVHNLSFELLPGEKSPGQFLRVNKFFHIEGRCILYARKLNFAHGVTHENFLQFLKCINPEARDTIRDLVLPTFQVDLKSSRRIVYKRPNHDHWVAEMEKVPVLPNLRTVEILQSLRETNFSIGPLCKLVSGGKLEELKFRTMGYKKWRMEHVNSHDLRALGFKCWGSVTERHLNETWLWVLMGYTFRITKVETLES